VRGLHTLKSLLLFGARDGHAPPFLAVHRGGWSLSCPIYGGVLPVTACVLQALSSLANSALPPLQAACFGCFSAFCVLCIPPVSPI
jgi:hypothetical protein